MTILARSALFFTAYAPLLAVLSIRVFPISVEEALALLLLSVLLVSVGVLLFGLWQRGNRFEVRITEADRLSDTAPAFLVGYLLPFLLIDLRDTYAVTASLVFIGLLVVAYVRAGLLYANPLLILFGLHIWKIRGVQTPGRGSEATLVLISHDRDLRPGDIVITRGDEDGIRAGERKP